MYRKILVGYDDSDQAKDALALGQQVATATGGELVVAGVFRYDPIWGDYDGSLREWETEFARQIEAAAETVGAEAEATPSCSPGRGLHELAEELGADLILVGSSHHGPIGQSVAGSVGVSLLHGSPCAVGIAPSGYRDQAEHGIDAIVVGFDASPEARLAVAAADELAHHAGATLELLMVVEPPPFAMGKGGNAGRQELMEAIVEQARRQLGEARDGLGAGIETGATVLSGDPGDSLSNATKAPGTLLMVGSRAYGPLRRVLLGSVSRRLVRSAPCPVIVTPRGIHVSAVAAEREELKASP